MNGMLGPGQQAPEVNVQPNQAAPPEQMPAQQGAPQPTEQPNTGSVTPPKPVRQPPRDYKTNPLRPEELQDLDRFRAIATQFIHTPKVRDSIVKRFKGHQHPYQEAAEASLAVFNMIDQKTTEKGRPFDNAIKVVGGFDVVNKVCDLGEATGKLPSPTPEEDRKIILGQTVQQYYNQKIASGEITRDEAARDAHIAAQVQQEMKDPSRREEVSGQLSEIEAKQNEVKANEKQIGNPAGINTPKPASNPMNPETTMKEVLASGEGMLGNG